MRFLAAIFGLVVSLAACAQDDKSSAPAYVEGVHYTLLDKPVRTITPGKIEVTEAFSYTCGHCFNFEPIINAWQAGLADDVELVKLPVIWRSSMQHYARIMYTGKALGVSKQLDNLAFSAIHRQKNQLTTEGAAAALFGQLGVPEDKFKKAFNSFGVSSQVQQASARTKAMKITGTPQLIVDGRYSISASRELSHEGMLKVADFLVEKIRQQR